MADISYHGPVVAFDLDDTLFRERDFCRSGFKYLCDRDKYRVLQGPDYPSREELDSLSARMDAELTAGRNPFVPFEDFFRPLAEQQNQKWDFAVHLLAYRSHLPAHLTLDPEIKSTLDTLSERGIKMALITDGRSNTQRRKIEALGLDRYIPEEMILISEETGFEKLHSKEMFATVVRHYPEAKEFFYVGNNPEKDFYHPNLMGWTTVNVPPHPDDVHPDAMPPSQLHEAKYKLKKFSYLCDLIPFK